MPKVQGLSDRPHAMSVTDTGYLMRLFLTGGTGLVGSHLAERWLARRGPVRALTRAGGRAHLEALGCEGVEGDVRGALGEGALGEGASGGASDASDLALARAMEGCDAVVHAAAISYSKLSWREVAAVNVEGTRRVLEAACAAGVPRIVHLSSLAVFGDPPPDRHEARHGGLSEDSPWRGALRSYEHYACSKREGEAVAEGVVARLGGATTQLTIIRPGAVYGERDRLFTPMMAGWLRAPFQLLPGGGKKPIPLVYAGNLAQAIELALFRDAFPGEARGGQVRVYHVGADHQVGQRDVLRALARGGAGRFRPISVPPRFARVGARWLERVGVRLPGSEELPLERAARFAGEGNPFSSERIRDELGWVPEVGAEAALERTARWWGGY